MVRIGILGASGYTGYELVRILRNHPEVKITALGANSNAGKALSDLFDGAATWIDLPIMSPMADMDLGALDAVFCALPHGKSADGVKQALEHSNIRAVIDLSNDHRLKSYDDYDGFEGDHPYPDIAAQAVYGLSEIYSREIAAGRLIANPGCYPTSILLPLIPLLKSGVIKGDQIIANSASGTTGAGRSASVGQLHSEVSENFKAYGLGTHRHGLEIQQEIDLASGDPQTRKAIFSPHLLPINRGILSTITVALRPGQSLEAAQEVLENAYAAAPFAHVAKPGAPITTKSVRGTNMCRFSLHKSINSDQIIITSAIDNLMKGAAGQAVQNMNLCLGLDEGLALSNLSTLQP